MRTKAAVLIVLGGLMVFSATALSARPMVYPACCSGSGDCGGERCCVLENKPDCSEDQVGYCMSACPSSEAR